MSDTLGRYIIGLSGTGKSTFLAHQILADAGENRGLAVLDPHGTLYEELVPRIGRDDVVLIDAADTSCPIGLNLFECSNPSDPVAVERTVNNVMATFERVWGIGEQASWGVNLENLLRNASHTLVRIPGSTLGDLPRLLFDKDYRQAITSRLDLPIGVRSFWQRFDQLDRIGLERWTGPVMNKVEPFLNSVYLTPVVTSPTTTIDFDAIVEDGQIMLVSLPVQTLGIDAVSLLGTAIITRLMDAGQRRASREPFMLYLDEFYRFTPAAMGDLFNEFRKFGFAATVAHQQRDQLPRSMVNTTLGAGMVVVFRCNPLDKEPLSHVFDVRGEEEEYGEEQILEVARDPWGELRARGHPNYRVMQYYNAVRRALEEYRDLLEWWSSIRSTYGGKWRRETPNYAQVTTEVEKLEGLIREHLQALRVPAGTNIPNSAREEDGPWTDEALELFSRREQGYSDIHITMDFSRAEIESDGGRWSELNQQWKREILSIIGELWGNLKDLTNALAEQPLMLPSGQTRPRTRRRSVADLRAEFANELAQLPHFINMYKDRSDGGQMVGRVDPLPDLTAEQIAQGEALRLYAKQFCRPTPPTGTVYYNAPPPAQKKLPPKPF